MSEISEQTEERLRKAILQLKIAGYAIGESANHVKPFKASKFLNVLMKEIYQLEQELRCFLQGEVPDKSLLWSEKQSSYLIMNAMKEDGLLKKKGVTGT